MGTSWKTKALLAILYAGFLLAIAEAGSRVFWRAGHGVPLINDQPSDWYSVFFPGFGRFRPPTHPSRDIDTTLDVLLLGGSVLENLVTNSPGRLKARLESETGQKVRVINFARAGHTTRDSVLKYRLLEGASFDLVILYHGINDVRMNNVSPEKFRGDYTHAAWYDKIEHMLRLQPWETSLRLPFTIKFATIEIADKMLNRYVPTSTPKPDLTQYGGRMLAAQSFRANVEEIARAAADRGEHLLLMTFAWHLPPADFLARFPDARFLTARTAIWGREAHIIKGMETHNRVLRQWPRSKHISFVDVEAALAETKWTQLLFYDICHFNDDGEQAWMDAFMPAVRGALAGDPAPR